MQRPPCASVFLPEQELHAPSSGFLVGFNPNSFLCTIVAIISGVQLATLEAELVILGSGTRNRFPPPAWLAPLMARRLGLETMDTAAACRTYNILAGEGRNVVAALILET